MHSTVSKEKQQRDSRNSKKNTRRAELSSLTSSSASAVGFHYVLVPLQIFILLPTTNVKALALQAPVTAPATRSQGISP